MRNSLRAQNRVKQLTVALCSTYFFLALSLVVSTSELAAETLPNRRPALVGNGPKSLVNLIDAEGLLRKGQGDAWVMFEASIAGDGICWPTEFFTFSPNSKLLQEEVFKRLRDARFVPAVYDGQRTQSWFAGTVVYTVVSGRPHLRVYANQERDEIKRGSDYIAPQLVNRPREYFIPGVPYYPSVAYHGNTGGVIKLRHSVDADGKTTDLQAISEQPPGYKFGETAVKTIRLLTFLPAYRNGRPVGATYTLTWWFGTARRQQI
jgi:TonB family protein